MVNLEKSAQSMQLSHTRLCLVFPCDTSSTLSPRVDADDKTSSITAESHNCDPLDKMHIALKGKSGT